MYWILIAFISPILHGFANILDNYLANKLFKKLSTLIFYSSILNVVFLPFVFLIQIPDLPPAHLLPFFLLIGLIEVFYLFPYYKALQSEDTSVITALFSLGRIFVPILAFIFVREVLHFTQYLGFLIIVISSAAVTFKGQIKFRLNKSFLYMLLCSLLLSIEAVIYKYLFENVSWSTGFVWPVVISFVIGMCFLFVTKLREDIVINRKNFLKKSAHICYGRSPDLWRFRRSRVCHIFSSRNISKGHRLLPGIFCSDICSFAPQIFSPHL